MNPDLSKTNLNLELQTRQVTLGQFLGGLHGPSLHPIRTPEILSATPKTQGSDAGAASDIDIMEILVPEL